MDLEPKRLTEMNVSRIFPDLLWRLSLGFCLGGLAGCQPPAAPKETAGDSSRATSGDSLADTGESESVPPAASAVSETPGPTISDPNELPEMPIPTHPVTAREHLEVREALDRTLWGQEVDAQRHEDVFIQLWDDLRLQADAYAVLKQFPCERLSLNRAGEPRSYDLGIQVYPLDQPPQVLGQDEWRGWLDELAAMGVRIEQTEWHHSKFQRLDPQSSRSTINFAIDAVRESPAQRFTVRGELEVTWDDTLAATPRPADISTRDVTLLVREGAVAFAEMLSATTDTQHSRLMPLVVYDLDGDDHSDILLGGINRIYFNQGDGTFRDEPLCAGGLDIFDAAVLADFTGDGAVDLVCVGPERQPLILEGDQRGRFPGPPRRCADFYLEFPKSFTAGDIDGDGDLDVWIGQYKFPYAAGTMPTPFYDANDGYPSVLLQNDGRGNFTDVTIPAGLTSKRNRRTYSSSFVDLDDDNDLDLLVVSDFSGIDLYQNDGKGHFVDVTEVMLYERHHFGMAHTFGDYDLDGHLDFYVIGMSSTTARRLDEMQLGRDDHPDINRMRHVMGYGNRMYLSRDTSQGRIFARPEFASQVARTGWSWGTTSFDFDNDGDRDIYVANGHNSGKSAKDYCTRYWCHDVYTGSSEPDPELNKLFGQALRDLHQGEISWNGFEHNVLLMNQHGQGFLNAAFLLGVAFEFDGRAVVSDDLDGDGLPDLLVTEYRSQRLGDAEFELHVLKNRLPVRRHWIGVRLRQSLGGPSPLGARVALRSDAGEQVARIVTGDSFSSQHPPVAHFGLGDQSRPASLEVRWLDGTTQRIDAPAVDAWYAVDPRDGFREISPPADSQLPSEPTVTLPE